jgi:1-acyl-sn-glycerol-3-phosphate acyltransferase
VLYAVLQPLSHGLLRTLFRCQVTGVEHVPRSGPAILAANHMSVFDPPVVGAPAPRPIHYMAKAELFRIPGLGWLIRRLNAHPVERGGADAAAMRLALRLLSEGEALLVFPEGTRGEEGRLRRAHAGTGMLTALSGAPVIPVLLTGTGRVLPRGTWLPRLTRITVTYGAPLRFDRARGKARYQAISDEIMAAIGRLRDEVGLGLRPGTAPFDDPAAHTTPERVSMGPFQ